ncbi:MAG: hypothetical protein IKE76_04790 [Clostridia bacterium]|nr:hypothetical protein [Clostridia bacterium]
MPVEGDAAECEAELTGEDAPEGEADPDEAGAPLFAAEAAFEGGTLSTKEEFDNWYAAA